MSYPARGSMQPGRGAPSQDGDLTAESIIGAAIPVQRDSGRIPDESGPLLHRVRRPIPRWGSTAARFAQTADTTIRSNTSVISEAAR